MKAFYACIDGSIPAPQPVQHLVIRDRAQKTGGAVTFYGAEDVRALGSQPFIRLKLARLKETGLDGVIFYTLHQFRYGGALNYGLLRALLDLGLEVHFACEGIAIPDRKALDDLFPFLLSGDYAARRDRSETWRKFVAQIDVDKAEGGVGREESEG